MRWAALAALVLLLPAAEAGLTLGAPEVADGPLQPNGAGVNVTVPFEVRCDANEVSPDGLALVVDPVAAPHGVRVAGALGPFAVPASACQGAASQAWQGRLEFTLTASLDAAGDAPLSFGVTARARGGDGVAQWEHSASTTVPFRVAYRGLLTASAARGIVEAQPGEPFAFDVYLTNLGNARSNVAFRLVEPLPDGWTVRFPDGVELRTSAETGGQSGVHARVEAEAPPEAREAQVPVRIALRPVSARDPALAGDEVTVDLLARVRCGAGASCGLASPAVGPIVAVALLGCALLARRR